MEKQISEKGLNETLFRVCRQFCLTYPQIHSTVSNEFKQEDLGQLNAYVGYYKKNEMMQGDNPPVGILLCTDKGSQMVEYALSGMDNQLFVSTYMLHLPDKKKLEAFILKEMEEMGI